MIGIGSKLMSGLQALWGVILANPIVLIVAAIAAAVAAFIYFWNTSEEFRQFWINLWEAIKTAVQTVVDGIVNFFTVTVPEAFNSFVAFFQGLWEGIKSFFSGIWEGMKEVVNTAWEPSVVYTGKQKKPGRSASSSLTHPAGHRCPYLVFTICSCL